MKLPLALSLSLLSLIACTEANGSRSQAAHHAHGTHNGMTASFQGGDTSGYLELKLHDDKGDLELWLARDAGLKQPFDLPVGAIVEVEFMDLEGRRVSLRPRNTHQNEDESGKPNLRDGKTNYFIFPTKPDEDASWLKGKTFQSMVCVRFKLDGEEFVSQQLKLAPHSH